MDKNIADIINKLKSLIILIEDGGFKITKAYLFGSYANNNYNEYSDIDLALISKDFIGIRFRDKQRIGEYVLSVDSAIEPITFRPEDFTEDNPIAKEIMNTGISII